MLTKLLITVGLTLTIANAAFSATYSLNLDSSQLSMYASGYQLDFILAGGAGNDVTVSNPNFGTGLLLPGQASSIQLSSDTINFGGSATWQFTPGDSVSFILSTTDLGPPAGFSPDELIIDLEDLQGDSYATNGPENSLFFMTLTGDPDEDAPELSSGTEAPIDGLSFTLRSADLQPVPEPASGLLFALASTVVGLSLAGWRADS